jgi:hypothetical protein
VHLEIKGDVSNTKWNVAGETKRWGNSAVSGLHLEDYAGVIRKGKIMADGLGHRNYLRATIHDTLDLLLVVDDREDRTDCRRFHGDDQITGNGPRVVEYGIWVWNYQAAIR